MTDLTPRTGHDDTPAPASRGRRVLPMIVLGLVLVAGGVIVTQFLRSAVDYYCNVDEIGERRIVGVRLPEARADVIAWSELLSTGAEQAREPFRLGSGGKLYKLVPDPCGSIRSFLGYRHEMGRFGD